MYPIFEGCELANLKHGGEDVKASICAQILTCDRFVYWQSTQAVTAVCAISAGSAVLA